MECTVRWMGSDAGMSFVAESGSGHAIVMDGAPDAGGRNLGPRPMEMVLAGTGGCTAFDVVLILKRGRHAVSGCEVRLTAKRAEADFVSTSTGFAPKGYSAEDLALIFKKLKGRARMKAGRVMRLAIA